MTCIPHAYLLHDALSTQLLPYGLPASRFPRLESCCVFRGSGEQLNDAFLVGLEVPPGSRVVGYTVQEAGLRGLPGLYLTSVKRGAGVVHAVGPDFIISTSDVLFFAGELNEVRCFRTLQELGKSAIALFRFSAVLHAGPLRIGHCSTWAMGHGGAGHRARGTGHGEFCVNSMLCLLSASPLGGACFCH